MLYVGLEDFDHSRNVDAVWRADSTSTNPIERTLSLLRELFFFKGKKVTSAEKCWNCWKNAESIYFNDFLWLFHVYLENLYIILWIIIYFINFYDNSYLFIIKYL